MNKETFTRDRNTYDTDFEGDAADADDGMWHTAKVAGFEDGYFAGHDRGLAEGLRQASEFILTADEAFTTVGHMRTWMGQQLQKQADEIEQKKD